MVSQLSVVIRDEQETSPTMSPTIITDENVNQQFYLEEPLEILSILDQVPIYEPPSYSSNIEPLDRSNVETKDDDFHRGYMEMISSFPPNNHNHNSSRRSSSNNNNTEKKTKKFKLTGIEGIDAIPSEPGVVQVSQDGTESSTRTLNREKKKTRRSSISSISSSSTCANTKASRRRSMGSSTAPMDESILPEEDEPDEQVDDVPHPKPSIRDKVAEKLMRNSRVVQVITGRMSWSKTWPEKRELLDEEIEENRNQTDWEQQRRQRQRERERNRPVRGPWNRRLHIPLQSNRDIGDSTRRDDEYSYKEEQYSNWREWNLRSALFIGVVAVAMLVIFLITSSRSANEKLEDYHDVLSVFTDTSMLINDENSAQARALDWIVNKDKLGLRSDSPNLVQRYCLMVLYFSASRDNWSFDGVDWISDGNDGTGVDECDWDFVECEGNEVVKVHIENQPGRGSLPSEICVLTNLKSLELVSISLTGTLPDSWGNLTSLETLDLSLNKIDGSIPSSLFELSTLKDLTLEGNQLTGEIDEKIGELSQLQYLNLQANGLGGKLPSSIGLLHQLDFIYLDDNAFSGSIPLDLEYIMARIEVSISNNYLSGELPSPRENASASLSHDQTDVRIESINLKSNRLRGWIPSGFGEMTTLRRLELSQNFLNGTIIDMGNLTSLGKKLLVYFQMSVFR